jgi:hypothetical protein
MQDVMSREQTIPVPADYFHSNSVFGLNFALISIPRQRCRPANAATWIGDRSGARETGCAGAMVPTKPLNTPRFAAYIEVSINNERR